MVKSVIFYLYLGQVSYYVFVQTISNSHFSILFVFLTQHSITTASYYIDTTPRPLNKGKDLFMGKLLQIEPTL